MKVLAVLQARYSSSRLPGKVLKPLLGEPMLFRQIERVRRSSRIDHLVLATSLDASDDPIEEMCREKSVDCFRGNLDDVLDRFYQAASRYSPEYVMRLTGDCPLFDPAIADSLAEFMEEGSYDYVSNVLEPTFPDGLDVELMTFASLERAWKQADLASEREHVTPYIYGHPELFSIGGMKHDQDLSRLRWTVDEPADLRFVESVYSALYPEDPCFGFAQVLDLMDRDKTLGELNRGISRNEGYAKSLVEDGTVEGKS